MAKTTTELSILITVTNQAKEAIGDALKSLNQIKSTLDGMSGVGDGVSQAADSVKKLGDASESAHGKLNHVAEGGLRLNEIFEKLVGTVKLLTGGFLAFEAVKMAKEILDVAARTETLGVVLNVVGKNAGYTTQQLQETDKAVQHLGITAEASRQSLTQLIQAGISLDLAKPLARASQDLAVISGVNSSETFKRLVTNIEQTDTLGLRFMGIMIDREAVFAKAAAETGKSITGTAQAQIFANAVLEQATKLTGVYEASMNSVGKLLTSFPRYVEEFKDALGSLGQEVYLELVRGTIEVIKAFSELAGSFKETEKNAELFGEGAEGAYKSVNGLAYGIREVSKAIAETIKFLKDHHTILTLIRDVLLGLVAGYAIVGTWNAIFATLAVAGKILGVVYSVAATAFATFAGAATLVEGALAVLTGPIGIAIGLAVALGGALYWLVGKTAEAAGSFASLDGAVDAYAAKSRQLIAAQKDLAAAAEQVRLASNRQVTASNDAEKTAANKEVEAANKKKKAAEEQISKLNDERSKIVHDIGEQFGTLDLDSAAAKKIATIDKETAAIEEALTKEQNFFKNLIADLNTLGDDYGSFTRGISTKTQQSVSAITSNLDKLTHTGIDAASAISATLRDVERFATGVKTVAEFDLVLQAIEKVKARFKSLGVDATEELDAVVAQMKSNLDTALAQEKAGGVEAAQLKKLISKRKVQLITELMQAEANASKEMDAISLGQDKFRYDQGLLLLETYYQRRVEASNRAAAYEVKVNDARIAELENEKRDELNEAKKVFIQQQINAARDKGLQGQLKQQEELQKIEIDRANTEVKLAQHVNAIKVSLNESYGHLVLAAQQASQAALDNELRANHVLLESKEGQIIAEKNRLDLAEKTAKITNDRALKELELKKALLDLNDSEIKGKQNDGALTSLEAQSQLNSIIVQRIEYINKEIEATKALRDQYYKLKDVQKGDEANLKMIQLTASVNGLRDSIVLVSDTLRTTFENSFASNLDAIIERTKSFKQGLLGIFTDLNKQILSTLTKDLAQNFTKGLQGLGSEGGGGFFKQLAELVTGKKEVDKPKPTGAKDSPIYTELATPTGAEQDQKDTKIIIKSSLEKLEKIEDHASKIRDKILQSNEDQLRQNRSTPASQSLSPGEVLADPTTGKPISLSGANSAVDKLVEMGWTREQAAGIAANLQRESSFNSKAVGDGGQAFGIGQWHPDRQEDFKKRFGVDIKDSTSDQQLQFVNYELTEGKKKAVGDALRNTTSADEAGRLISRRYEIPRDPDGTEAAARGKLASSIAGTESSPVVVKVASSDAVASAGRKSASVSGGGVSAPVEAKDDGPSGSITDPIYVRVVADSTGISTSGTAAGTSPAGKGAAGNQLPSTSGGGSNAFDVVSGFAPILGAAAGAKAGGPLGSTVGAILGTVFQKAVTKDTFNGLTNSLSKGFEGVKNAAEGGGLGISDFFSAFGKTLSNFFKSGGGSGGGLGDFFSGLFSGGSSTSLDALNGAGSVVVGLAGGGPVFGPGTGTSDSIHAMLSNGEYVMTAEKTGRYLPLLEAMRIGSLDTAMNNLFGSMSIDIPRTPAYAGGGYVSQSNTVSAGQKAAPTIVMHVHTPDANSFRKSRDQISADMGQAANRALRRNS